MNRPPDPAPVPADVYTREYFLHKRQGADEFAASGGRALSPIHARLLSLAAPAPGRRILDVGCGCGELTIHAALAGADATGIDYAPDAHALAVETAAKLGARARFLLADVAHLPDETFDVALLADIVEHLHPHQLRALYAALRERLSADGMIVVHTWPNRWHTEYAYPVARLLLALFGIRKPKSPRQPHDEIMHVNEQSPRSLRRDLEERGFRVKVWLEHPSPAGAGVIYRLAHGAPLVKLFFADHIFAVGHVGER